MKPVINPSERLPFYRFRLEGVESRKEAWVEYSIFVSTFGLKTLRNLDETTNICL